MTTGSEQIAAERKRQIEEEGWIPEHDDEHPNGSLVRAAMLYALMSSGLPKCVQLAIGHWRINFDLDDWLRERVGWRHGWFKPGDPVGNLVKAGALIAAEIDRLQRARDGQ